MSLQHTIRDTLKTSVGLVAAFTGGIIAYDDMDGYGLTRTSYPAAFSTTSPVLKPLILVRERFKVTTGNVIDEEENARSFTQAVEIWFYNDRKAGYTVINAAETTARGLLNYSTLGGCRLERREVRVYDRDPDLEHACVVLAIYDARGVET